MTSLWNLPDFDEHELVHFVTDRATGLKAVIGVHSTHLGPGAGGTRFWHYAKPEDAVADVLRLSRGMSYKNAMAGLPLGGGKSVILADESRSKSPELLAALSALAVYWKDDPRASEVLADALRHSDPEIRAAASAAA